ncbi:MAG TPA: hypothetical protein DCS87_03645 [Rheinheimera sp.]|nr:hypothetical protein [Rheinheimera sp.]
MAVGCWLLPNSMVADGAKSQRLMVSHSPLQHLCGRFNSPATAPPPRQEPPSPTPATSVVATAK